MEVVGSVAGEVTGSTIVHVEREFGYLIHFRKSTNSLKHKIQQLTVTKSGVQSMIDAALRNGELINPLVQYWMTRADLVLSQATELSNEASAIKGWFRGWCCGRFSLGRKAEKKIIVIQGLCVEGSGFSANNISYPKPTQSLKLVETEDFNAFASREHIAEEISKSLLDDETNLVGVYGMPGVGKTVLIKAIAKQVKEERVFQEVVVVIVSQNPNLIKIQGDIAEGLDLSLTGDNLSRRAERLFERLNQDDKTTLVVLDDVWERIELSDVGIPRGKCCKVVFTTRFRNVCDTMEANTKIEVVVLSDEDSWILFQKRSGNIEDSSLARDVLKECKGLPLAITTLGRALRNKDAIVWADALKQLRKSIFEGMSSVVSSIKLSYNFLESESVKICLLFCCLFPEDHKIQLDVLLMYMMSEKLLEDVDTYDEARGRLHGIVDKLVSCGLLLRGHYEEIMMHDVVRDVAILIAAEEKGHIVKAGRNLSFWPDMNLDNCKRLSMMYNPIQNFPTIPIKAPHLQALFLNDNNSLTELPPDIFASMKSLMTLDLSRLGIKSLPPSLSCLQNLRALLLDHTYLQTISPIEKLERLEVLNLRDSLIQYEEYVEEIRNLSDLRILDLTGTFSSSGYKIRPALFSKLRRLEEFHMLESPAHERHESREIDLCREIGSLARLTSLELDVYNSELCHIDIPGPWQNLTRFHIGINRASHRVWGNTRFSRSLVFYDIGVKLFRCANWVLVLIGRATCLRLGEWDDLQSLTELGAGVSQGMNENLKLLYIRNFSKMECLVSSNTGSHQNAFLSNLEELEIVDMPAFVEICKGTPPPRFLQNLKELTIYNCGGLVFAIPRKLLQNLRNLKHLDIADCNNLMHVVEMEEEEENVVSSNSNLSRVIISEPLVFPIFPNLKKFEISEYPESKIRFVLTMRVARNLLQLQHLVIETCEKMEVILKYGDGEDILFNEDTAILPRLQKLTVRDAPQLKSFTNRNLVMELPSLEELKVVECFMLERLPFVTTSVPNLKSVDMEQECLDRLEWEDESVKQRLQALRWVNPNIQ